MISSVGAPAKSLLFDATRCVGCGACALACRERSRARARPADQLRADRAETTLQLRDGRYVRRMCMHCLTPTCAASCPVGALSKSPEGPVLYDESRCIGCRYCIQACPFSAPRYEWGAVLPRMRKCDMCADRIAQGLGTACATVCPTGATTFGARGEMLAEARARIASHPDRYVDHVYGEHEAGGTSVLLIADESLERLGYPAGLGDDPIPLRTWEVLSKVPRFAVAAAVGLSGLWWITKRRADVAREEAR